MKKILIVLLTGISFVFLSCNKETPASPNDTNDASQSVDKSAKIKNPATEVFGTDWQWRVVSFMNNGIDQATAFSTSMLRFSPDNTFTISNDIMAANGSWNFERLGESTYFLDLSYNSGTANNDWWNMLAGEWKVTLLQINSLVLQSEDGTKIISLQKLSR